MHDFCYRSFANKLLCRRSGVMGLLIIGGFCLLLAGCGERSVAEKPTKAGAVETAAKSGAVAGAKVGPVADGVTVTPGMQANPLESTNIMRSFVAAGVIVSLPQDGKSVVIKHEAIPGFMPKMTMEFEVRNTSELRGLVAGDFIHFEVKANETESWVEGLHRAAPGSVAPAAPSDPSSAAILHAAKLNIGDPLDAELMAEDGRTIKPSDFKGKAVAFTFIFTRCPLPDFCPRMNQHFSQARATLAAKSEGPANWQFLSISFDPEFDKPGVLNRYAYSYRGEDTNRWMFAAASTNVMAALVPQLDFRFIDDSGSFVHNLRTVVLDAKSRIYKQFDGNKWKAQELAKAMTEAAQAK